MSLPIVWHVSPDADVNQCVYPISATLNCRGPASLVQCASMNCGTMCGGFGVGDGLAIEAPAIMVLQFSDRVCVTPCGDINVSTIPLDGHGGCVVMTGNVTFPGPFTDGYDALPVG